MIDRIEVRLLGPLQLLVAGRAVPLPGGRSRALLALLALGAGRTVSVDRIIADLWGDTPPATVRTALHGLVSGLRTRLEPGRAAHQPPRVLITRPPGYLLDVPAEGVDAHQFRVLVRRAAAAVTEERAVLLREALSLWHGAVLEDVELAGPDLAEVVALEELRVGALEERIDADLALGRHDELVGELEMLVAAHPYRERLRGQLMLALYRSGRQVDALEVWRQARTVFLEQVGVEPGPGLHTLHQAVLTHDPGLDLTAGGSRETDDAERARDLTARAGELLAAAGARVFDRHYDAETALDLFARAELLLPADHPRHDEVADQVPGIYLMLGRHGDADAWLVRSLAGSRGAGNARRRRHLQLERARLQLILGPDPIPLDELEAVAVGARAAAEAQGDDDLLSQACYVLGLVALRQGQVVRMEELARVAVAAADRSGSPREQLASRWWLALALVEGPTRIDAAIDECEGLVEMGRAPHLGVLTELARLESLRGAQPAAREHLARAEALLEQRPGMARPAMFVALRGAEVDAMAGCWEDAERRLRRALALADELGEADQRAQVAARLSRTVVELGSVAEADQLAHLSRQTAPAQSITAQALWRVARAAVKSATTDERGSRELLEETLSLVPGEMVLLRHTVGADL